MGAKVQALQAWCKYVCRDYRDVAITNMSSSWKSGLAFCAMIHRYRPDLIDYDSLSKENVYENNKLAFDVAEQELDIPALLDAEDMVVMRVPDKLCIVTYVSQYYNYFGNKEQKGGPGVKGKVAVKREHPSDDSPNPFKPENRESKRVARPSSPSSRSPSSTTSSSSKSGTLGDTCTICGKKVYIMERIIQDMKLYHRTCIREKQRSMKTPSPAGRSPAGHSPAGRSPRSSSKPTFTFPDRTPARGGGGGGGGGGGKEHLPQHMRSNGTKERPQSPQHQAEKRKVQSNPFVTADHQKKEPEHIAEQPTKKPFLATVKKAERAPPPWEVDSKAPKKLSTLNSTPAPYKPASNGDAGFSDGQKDFSSVFHRPFMPKETDKEEDSKKNVVSEVTLKNMNARNAFLKNGGDSDKTNGTKVDSKVPTSSKSAFRGTESKGTSSLSTVTTTTSSSRFGASSPATTTTTFSTTTTTSSSSSQNHRPPFSSGQKATPLSRTALKVEDKKPETEVVGKITVLNPPKTKAANGDTTATKHETKTFHSLLDNLALVRTQRQPSPSRVGVEKDSTSNSHKDGNQTKLNGVAQKSDKSSEKKSRLDSSACPPPLPASLPPPLSSNKKAVDVKKPRSTSPAPTKVNDNKGKSYLSKTTEPKTKISETKASLAPTKKVECKENPRSLSPAWQRRVVKEEKDDPRRSPIPKKSILKGHDEEVTKPKLAGDRSPKSILKSPFDSSSRGRSESPKPILKTGNEIDAERARTRNASPRSILKQQNEIKTAEVNPRRSSLDSILKPSPSKGSEHLSANGRSESPKSILKHNEEEMDTTSKQGFRRSSLDSILKPSPEKSSSPTPPKKSILRNKPDSAPQSQFYVSTPQKSDSGPSEGNTTGNRFSAFNVKDSVAVDRAKSKGAKAPKSVWQIEFEARQGIRQKEPKVGIGYDRNQKQMAANQNKIQREHVADGEKTEWQLEAERRAMIRGGEYVDPEFKGRSDTKKDGVENLDKLGKKSPKTQRRHVSPGRVQTAELSTSRDVDTGGYKGLSVDGGRKSRAKSPFRAIGFSKDNKKEDIVDSPKTGRKKMSHIVSPRESPRDSPGDSPKINARDSPRDSPKISPTEGPIGSPTDKRDKPSTTETPISRAPKKSPRVDPAVTSPGMDKTPEKSSPMRRKGAMSNSGGKNRKTTMYEEPSKVNEKVSNDEELDELNQLLLNENSEDVIFGRTGVDVKGGRLSRSPAFKVSPTTSPDSSPPLKHATKQSPLASPETTKSKAKRPDTLASKDTRPAWQIEAERRQKARKGEYVDPEKNPRRVISPPSPYEEDPPTPPPPMKKIVPDHTFRFSDQWEKEEGVSSPESPVPPPRKGKKSPNWIQSRPLPSPPKNQQDFENQEALKRKVNAEQRMSTTVIMEQLQTLDNTLQRLESQGRTLEEKIRSASDEAMDEDEMMVEWFELINEKNELVRHESDLMYKQKQQEYEDLHEELEYELRLLMSKPEHLKTSSDKVREESLLQELLDTVSLRNNIVDSMEEDRLRYIEEDQEIKGVMDARSFSEEPPSPKKKGSGKKKKNKQKRKKEKERQKKKGQKVESPTKSSEEIDEFSLEAGDVNTMDNRTSCFRLSQGSSGK